jgi:predicted Rossmann-fold nucleotide-binding protein
MLLDVGGFWDPLLALVDAQVQAGFVPAASRAALSRVTGPGGVLAQLGQAPAERAG